MSNTRKFIVLIFTVMLVISLQFNVPVMTNMEEDFSIEQLVENIFIPDAYATWLDFCDWHEPKTHCYNGWCFFNWDPTLYCDDEL